VLLSIIASALYVFNDLMDIPRDRRHPIKRNRPLARGIIPLPNAWGLVIAGLVAGFGLAYVTLPSVVVHLLALYAVSSVAYSLALKHQPIVDVLMLGGLYTLRIIVGGSAARIEVSPWLLGFSLLFFASLALLKRHSEVVQLRTTPDLLERTRPYTTDDEPFLLATGIASASMAVVILVLYLTGERARMLYTHPDRLWLVLPLLLFWVMRMWRFSVQGRLQGDPLTASLRDPASIATAVAIIALVGFLAR
jgi:4-hydroxybenzoate polyprenyltransferase